MTNGRLAHRQVLRLPWSIQQQLLISGENVSWNLSTIESNLIKMAFVPTVFKRLTIAYFTGSFGSVVRKQG